eukprot:GILI01017854.1.p1 GENE.GILI01017854.1~~GILI01017854.1.p1  ORF type:complete len:187 (+),score=42.52 GILI01017854.1:36-596(+)
MAQVDRTIEFLHTLGKVKETPRTGWVEHKVPKVESVGDHMYRMSFMCMMCPDKSLDRDRMVRMALCHDMAESMVGDISPAMKVPKEEKHQMELDAINHMTSLLTPELSGPMMKEFFEEYEKQETREAKFVKDMDLLEMIVQAHRYEDIAKKDLSSFYRSGEKIEHPWAREIFERLRATRPLPNPSL